MLRCRSSTSTTAASVAAVGLVGGWLLGLILVVIGTVDVLAFIDTLGMGCGGGPGTPWSS
jgi:hypothetical protein